MIVVTAFQLAYSIPIDLENQERKSFVNVTLVSFGLFNLCLLSIFCIDAYKLQITVVATYFFDNVMAANWSIRTFSL